MLLKERALWQMLGRAKFVIFILKLWPSTILLQPARAYIASKLCYTMMHPIEFIEHADIDLFVTELMSGRCRFRGICWLWPVGIWRHAAWAHAVMCGVNQRLWRPVHLQLGPDLMEDLDRVNSKCR